MRSIFLIFVSGCCLGCGDSAELVALKSSLRITGEEVVSKQDESLTILRENTTALAAIKDQVESLGGELLETRRAVGTMEASLVKSEPQPGTEVIESNSEPQEVATPKPLPLKAAATTPAVRSSSGVKMSWNVNGNWSPTIIETATHLRSEHGVNIDGMTEQQLHDMHAALHEGRLVQTPLTGAIFPIPRQSAVLNSRPSVRSVSWGARFVGRARNSSRQSCPSGGCP